MFSCTYSAVSIWNSNGHSDNVSGDELCIIRIHWIFDVVLIQKTTTGHAAIPVRLPCTIRNTSLRYVSINTHISKSFMIYDYNVQMLCTVYCDKRGQGICTHKPTAVVIAVVTGMTYPYSIYTCMYIVYIYTYDYYRKWCSWILGFCCIVFVIQQRGSM